MDRLFRCDETDDRDDWVEKIKLVAEKLSFGPAKIEKTKKIDEMVIGPYRMQKLLGVGSFGIVVLAQNQQNKKYAAIKVMTKESIYDSVVLKEIGHIESEGRILKSYTHPFLISMIDSFQTKDRIYFVTEFLNGGELFYHLKICHGFTEARTKLYAAEVVLALQFLHSNKVIYRDLKLENTILDSEGHIKLCDFGSCKENTSNKDHLNTFCGTIEYFAPETILNTAVGYSIDWWCLGIFMYECLTSRLPFSVASSNSMVLHNSILEKSVNFSQYQLSKTAKDIITNLLVKDPTKRLGCSILDGEEVKNHIFFQEYDWEDVYNKKTIPEFVPILNGPNDTRYFKKETLSKPLHFTPPDKDIDYELDI
ncbi:hypothetical protein MXB_3639 [Myxobolus squamalis]|nr:hypothetical protein MXB_3639 [Myxobolus squamalis]